MPDSNLPIIPETITVHLGRPDSPARNVTLPFPDYIKNVASSEIYPTWPDAAIRANIYAQISFALNRVYTEFYRNQGYDFEITNSIANDQSFVEGRDIFENISQTVDEIFNSYIRRRGSVEPLFAVYCDGVEVSCNGLSQWGTVELAEAGMTPYEILQNYYGEDIDIVRNVPVEGLEESLPSVPLERGDAGPNVLFIQRRLNRISSNYPLIPKIYPTDGIFSKATEDAVKAFQAIFGLTQDGIVGPATWYRIGYIYIAVKRLSDIASEGLTLEEISTVYPNTLKRGDAGGGVRVLQYYLAYLSNYYASLPSVTTDGIFGAETERAVKAFEAEYGLPQSGIVDERVWDLLQDAYLGIIETIPLEYTEGVTVPFPGTILVLGEEGEAVRLLQSYLNYIASAYPEIPSLPVTGYYGNQTRDAVLAFGRIFGAPVGEGVVNSAVWGDITNVYTDIYLSNRVGEAQYPGRPIGQG